MRLPATLAILLLLAGCAQAGPAMPRQVAAGGTEALAAAGCALETGVPIYRVFRGMKRADVAKDAFYEDLATRFIPAAPKTHGGKGLVAYLPAVAPATAPAGTPDEIAIVVYASEAVYQERRATPEGKAYGDMHWELFDRPASKSDTAVGWTKNGPALAPNVPVDMFEAPTDWQCGHSVVYVGQRKKDVAPAAFLAKLSQHVARNKATFGPLGMRGYVVVASEDREIAWTNWSSKGAMTRAFASEAGKAAVAFGGAFLDTVQWTDAAPFKGAVAPGQAFNVKFPR